MGMAMQRLWTLRASTFDCVFLLLFLTAICQFRELETLLYQTPYASSRVLWCSSLEASPKFYDSKDWQLKTTEHSYESTKYQIDLIACHLDQMAIKAIPAGEKKIRHLITEPGVCSTTISAAIAGPILDKIKVLLFYIVCAFSLFFCPYSHSL
jgi:3-keto steroid reductase